MISYEIGKTVKSLAGHDKDTYYVIVGIEGSSILAADGKLKMLEDPKRKNIKHVQLLNDTCPEEAMKTNEGIKHFLKSFGGKNVKI